MASKDSRQSRSLTPPPVPDPGHDPKFTTLQDEEKRQTAWQYYGYPEYSKWMASSNDFFVLRKFSTLGARSLLYLQNEIAQREKKLEGWDAWTQQFSPGQGGCGSFRYDRGTQREELLLETIPLLEQYYNLTNSFTQVRGRRTARPHHRRNLLNWFETYPNAIDMEERLFLDPIKEGDLFPIISSERTPLAAILSRLRFLRLPFKLNAKGNQVSSPYTQYHSDTGFDIATGVVIIIVGLCLLFVPLWWLYFVARGIYRLGIITGAVSMFAAWLWMAAGTRPFEILAGTAAYAAVLIVYMQIQGQSPGG